MTRLSVLLLLASLLPACCKSSLEGDPSPQASGSADPMPAASDPTDPPSVELARDRGAYKGMVQLKLTRYDSKISQIEGKLDHRSPAAQALREAHWAIIRAGKAVESSDEESFPRARDDFEAACKTLDQKIAAAGG